MSAGTEGLLGGLVMEAVSDPVFVLDFQGRLVDFNEAVCEQFGYTREELKGMTSRDLLAPNHKHIVESVAQGVQEKGDLTFEADLIHKNGTVTPFEIRSTRISLEGEPGRLSILRNISRRKEAESFSHSVLEASPSCIKVLDRDGKVVFLNETGRRLLGAAQSEGLIGQDFVALWKGTNAEDDSRKAFQLALKGETVIFEGEKKVTPGRIEPQYWEVTLGPLRNAKGEIDRALSVSHDVTDRVQFSQALAASERRYRSLYESMRDGFLVTDLEWNLLEWNPAFRNLLGYDEENLGRLNIRDLTPARWVPLTDNMLMNQVSVRGFSDVYEKEYRHKDGHAVPVAVRTHLTRDEEGNPSGYWAIVRDYSDRKLVEEELRRERANLERAQSIANLGSYYRDLVTDEGYWSDQMYTIFGLDRDTTQPDLMLLTEYVHPDDLYLLPELLNALEKGVAEYEYTFRILRANGEVRFLRMLGEMELDRTGRPLSHEGVVLDETERRRAELALERQQILDSRMSVLSSKLLTEHHLDKVSRLALDTAGDLIGFKYGFVGILHPETGEILAQARSHERWDVCRNGGESLLFDRRCGFWNWILETHEPYMSNEFGSRSAFFELPHEDCGIKNCLAVPAVINDKLVGQIVLANAPQGFSESDRRVAQRLAGLLALSLQRAHFEAQLVRAKEEAEEASRAKSQFLATMSHEIRTPMNAIINMIEMARYSDLTDEQRGYLDVAGYSAAHLLEVINNILDISRVESGRLELESVDFDLVELIRSTVLALEYQAASKGLSLDLVLEGDHLRYVRGDPARLRQVIVNLVGNAIKFTLQGGVHVCAYCKERSCALEDRKELGPDDSPNIEITFRVSDTGIGIPADKMENVFEMFTQADGTITRKFGGTGLGLAISRQLVELMGGTMKVESVEGQGSEFSFTVPFQVGDPERIKPTRRAAQPSQKGQPQHILLVEDNAANVSVARALLNKLGHRMTLAENGQEALEALREMSFDTVLMDLEMPDMDGLEATRRIRAGEAGKEASEVPIIAMTAHALTGYREKSLEAGMNDYLSKPVVFKDLVRLLGWADEAPPPGLEASVAQEDFDTLEEHPLVSRAEAIERLAGDVNIHAQACAMFLESWEEKLDRLREGLESGDLEQATLAAHSLKGNCAMIGADPCREAAYLLEKACREKDVDRAKKHLPQLAHELDRLIPVLKKD